MVTTSVEQPSHFQLLFQKPLGHGVQAAATPASDAVTRTRAGPKGIQRMQWCPTMDLLAMVLGRTELAIYRLSAQRVLKHTLSAPAMRTDMGTRPGGIQTGSTYTLTCLEWRFDGKVLAIGDSMGHVHLLDLEANKVTHAIEPTQPDPVTWMQWVSYNAGPSDSPCLAKQSSRWEDAFPSLSPLPTTEQEKTTGKPSSAPTSTGPGAPANSTMSQRQQHADKTLLRAYTENIENLSCLLIVHESGTVRVR